MKMPMEPIAGEHPIAHIAQHWMNYAPAFLLMLASWFLYALCTVVSLSLMQSSHSFSIAILIAGHIFLLLFHHAAYYKFVSASMSHFLLTNRRILGSLQSPWLSEQVVDIPLVKIRTLEVNKGGILQHVLDYGAIVLNKSELPSLTHIPHPHSVHNQIAVQIQGKTGNEESAPQQETPRTVQVAVPSPSSSMDLSTKDQQFPHYYGHIVRRLFLAGGVIMLITLATLKHVLPIGTFVVIFAILIIGLFAGLTNPLQRWVAALDTLISLVALTTFEYHAVIGYTDLGDVLFWLNQLLAIVFFFAFYFATKTLRGTFLTRR